MRPLAVFVLLCAATNAVAQGTLQELPPPEISGPDEPAVQIPVQKEDKVEEMREGGRIVMLKVTPPNGRPYYLVDTSGNGNWMRRDPLDDGVRVPMWPVYIFE